MHVVSAGVLENWNALSDARLVAHVVSGRTALFEILMRRHTERVYRIIRAIVTDEGRAEELVRRAFIQAYANLPLFDGTAPFAIWLTQVAVSTARSDRRRSGLAIARLPAVWREPLSPLGPCRLSILE